MTVVFKDLWYCICPIEYRVGKIWGWYIIHFENIDEPELGTRGDVWLRSCTNKKYCFKKQTEHIRNGLLNGNILKYANLDTRKIPRGIHNGDIIDQDIMSGGNYGHNCTLKMLKSASFKVFKIDDIDHMDSFPDSLSFMMELIL